MTSRHDSPPRTALTSSHVRLVGRLGSSVSDRELPSGDVVSAFTVVVDRPAARGQAPTRVTVDAIPCQAFRAALRDRVHRLEPGVLVEVEGTLHRRFWRSARGLGSALEVDASRIRRVG